MPLRFEDDFLRKLEYLHVVSKRAFAGQNRADRLTPTRGRGLEFADHRPYAPGDDFRHIDWKAYKRLNRLLLRLFDEEQDLPIYLMIDASRSMAEPAKFDMARRLAAALCYIGLAHLDRMTILSFGARLGAETSPGRGKGRIFKVFELLEQMQASGATDLRRSFKEFASRPRHKGLTVIISDFLDPQGVEAGLKILRTLGHDVFAVHVTSRRDRDPFDVRRSAVRRCRDRRTSRDRCHAERLATAYVEAWNAHAARARASSADVTGIGYLRADAEQPFDEIVLNAFRQGRFVA